MLISINKSALNDPTGKFMFRENTIRALKTITDGGRDILIKEEEITPDQIKILEREGIYFMKKGDADLMIETLDENLILIEDGKELVTGSDWGNLVKFISTEARKASLIRKTNETDISIEVNLDGTGKAEISTGLKFFDHMLDQIARHGLIDMNLTCKGDLEVDEHHTIEDTAIALGEAFAKALGNKLGMERYGFCLPMDDCLAQVALDFGGRNWLVWEADFKREMIGKMPTEMFFHFFKSFSDGAKANLNIKAEGTNEHHKIEAIFKAFAKALKMAVKRDTEKMILPSTKGML